MSSCKRRERGITGNEIRTPVCRFFLRGKREGITGNEGGGDKDPPVCCVFLRGPEGIRERIAGREEGDIKVSFVFLQGKRKGITGNGGRGKEGGFTGNGEGPMVSFVFVQGKRKGITGNGGRGIRRSGLLVMKGPLHGRGRIRTPLCHVFLQEKREGDYWEWRRAPSCLEGGGLQVIRAPSCLTWGLQVMRGGG